jgi:hypothetical protein
MMTLQLLTAHPRGLLYDILQTMGVQLTIDVKRRFIVSTFDGEINDAEVYPSLP